MIIINILKFSILLNFNMKIFESQVNIREVLTFLIIVVVIRGAEYYLFSQDMLTLDQYRLSIQALVVLILVYLVVLTIRNRNIMMLRRSRHTRAYMGEELGDLVFKLRDEGKSVEEISIASGLSIEEVEEKLDTQKDEPNM